MLTTHTYSRRALRALGEWRELHVFEEPANPRSTVVVAKISTARFASVLFLVASIITLYIAHVYATQDLIDELQQLGRDNLQLTLQHNRLKGALDQATGPAVIYRRAAELGLEDGFTYGSPIVVPAQ